jgi:hypothetical protein
MLPFVILNREYRNDCTLGEVVLPGDIIIKTIERPWLNNKRGISCYPEGVYLCKYLRRSASGKYKRVWHVQNVPGRSGILWHNGNLVRHSRGCTIVGMNHGTLGDKPAVLSSRKALNVMRRALNERDFILVVTSNYRM